MNADNIKLLKNSALLVIGNFASKILVFFLVPFYTTVLSTEEYGAADLITTTVNLLYPVLTVMISTAVLRFCLDDKKNSVIILVNGVIVELAGFIFLLPITGLLSFFNGALRPYLPFLLLYYFSYSLNALLLQYAKGVNNVFVYAVAGVANTFCMIISNIILLVVLHMGVQGYLCALIVGLICSNMVLFFGCHIGKAIFQFHVDVDLLKQMLRYSFPMVANNLSWWINNSSDRYIMALFRSVAELGVYSVSYKIPSMISVITNIFISAWEISAVDEFGTEKSRQYFSKIYNLYTFVNVSVTGGVILFVRVIASIAFQKEFYDAWQFSPFLLIGHVFQTQSAFLGTIFTASKKSSSIMKTTLMGAVINTVLNLLLIPKWGAQGAAIATMIGYFCVWLVRLKTSRIILNIDVNIKRDIFAYVLLLFASGSMLSNKLTGTRIATALVTCLFVMFHQEWGILIKMCYNITVKKLHK